MTTDRKQPQAIPHEFGRESFGASTTTILFTHAGYRKLSLELVQENGSLEQDTGSEG